MPGRFAAGALSHTIAYCELENVSARQNAKGEWESRLTQQAVLYTEAGQRVWSTQRQAVSDSSRNRRQDFFVYVPITLLPNLSIGRYLLKITVEDEQVKRVAEATVPIEIVAAVAPSEGAQPRQGQPAQQRPAQQEQQPSQQPGDTAVPPAVAPSELGPVTEQDQSGPQRAEPQTARNRQPRGGDAITGAGDARNPG
jgi:hypothetical protein